MFMEHQRIEIRQFVVDNFLFGQDNGLTEEASFLEQGIIDSTGVMELVAHLEKAYGIHVADTELVPENLDSIAAVSRFVAQKRADQTALRAAA
jgi:acyl carrier protein